jgi:large subunit ribosomal protein L21e
MTKRVGGARRKTRGLFKKSAKKKGKISLTKYFQKLEQGEKVQLVAEPAVQDGMYFRRYHGRVGVIKGRRGRCYEVQVKDGSKTKEIIVHPVHLKRM